VRRPAAVALTAAALSLVAPATLPAAPAAAGASAPAGVLTWAPPVLDDPVTVQLAPGRTSLKLDLARDYVVQLPATPLDTSNGVSIYGGHDVVLVGGEVRTAGRGLYLRDQTGTVHVEGVRLSGAGATEGIDLDQRRGATVQLQNIAVETVNGSRSGDHADVLQTWAGPERLRVDRLEGSSTYQGLFLDPHKFLDDSPELFDLRNTVLRDAGGRSAYLLWQSGTFPITTQDVTVVPAPGKAFPGQVLWEKQGQGTWDHVARGDAATPSPLLGVPGTGYTSPGYAGQPAPAAPSTPAPDAAAPPTATTTTVGTPLGSMSVTRLEGGTRYETAVAVSRSSFPATAPEVVVASGADFPDALAAGQVATSRGGPLLLVRPDGALPSAVVAELQRLAPARITVLGGAASVSEGVLAQLRQHAGAVERLQGADRYATAASAATTASATGGTVFMASGQAFPDAVAGGALVARRGAALLLSRGDQLPEPTRAALQQLAPSRVVLLGSTAALSDAVLASVTAAAPQAVVERWGGQDRYATAAQIATSGTPAGSRTVVLAAGTNFPDALAGGPASGLQDAALLLVRPTCIPEAAQRALEQLAPTSLLVLGGGASLSRTASELAPC